MKTTVIYHSADMDGIFCREIARKFLPDAELIGWDFGDAPLVVPSGPIYVLDLPVDRVFGFQWKAGPKGTEIHFQKGADPAFLTSAMPFRFTERVTWIDHHASSIASHPKDIPGYRIDGVAACRLAWNWFAGNHHGEGEKYPLATKQEFVDRMVCPEEPLAVRLAGEHDVWDKRDPRSELFQHGLRSRDLDQREHFNTVCWNNLLSNDETFVEILLESGKSLQYARAQEYREVITQQGFDVQFEGLTFLACNSHELDIRSQLFEAGIKPHHDGLLGFTFGGKDWRVSLYGVPGKPDTDLSPIAVKHGGGGHRQACGFRTKTLPFPI